MNYKYEASPLFPAMQNPAHRLIADFELVALKASSEEKDILNFIHNNIDHPQLEEAMGKSKMLNFWVGRYIDAVERLENQGTNSVKGAL